MKFVDMLVLIAASAPLISSSPVTTADSVAKQDSGLNNLEARDPFLGAIGSILRNGGRAGAQAGARAGAKAGSRGGAAGAKGAAKGGAKNGLKDALKDGKKRLNEVDNRDPGLGLDGPPEEEEEASVVETD